MILLYVIFESPMKNFINFPDYVFFTLKSNPTSPQYTGRSFGHGDSERVDDGGCVSRRNFTKTLVPVNWRLLLQHYDHDQPFLVNGQKIGMVSLVRQVRQISQGNLSYSYLVEDDTGRIEAIHYIGDDNSSPPPLQ